jgi:carbon-monoxide dehydrogenase medium subunit
MLPEFELLMPRSLPEALAILAERKSEVMPIAGGTNVIVSLRDGCPGALALMDLHLIKELRGLRLEKKRVVIGGGTFVSDLLVDPLIREHGAVLRQAASHFANPLIRNRATVAGNLVDASPAADLAPPLLALDAEVELASAANKRWVPLSEFIVGVRETLRRPDELLTSVRWPGQVGRRHSTYYKLGLRRADAVSVVSAAVAVEQDGSGCCRAVQIALGAVAPRPMRAQEAEESLRAEELTPERIAQAARLAAAATDPIDDIRGTATYRRRVTEVIVRRLLTQVASEMQRP